jgi:hypothetical protein
MSRKLKFRENRTRIRGTVQEDPCTLFLSHFAQFFAEQEVFQTKFSENIKTQILYSITFFFENRADYESM